MKVNYKCTENDVNIRFYCEDGEIDEVWVQVNGETGWTVIGFKDLIAGIEKAKGKCKSKDSDNFGGGYIGEAISSIEQIKSDWDLKTCFQKLRSSKGDIRLSIAMQEEICRLIDSNYCKK